MIALNNIKIGVSQIVICSSKGPQNAPILMIFSKIFRGGMPPDPPSGASPLRGLLMAMAAPLQMSMLRACKYDNYMILPTVRFKSIQKNQKINSH